MREFVSEDEIEKAVNYLASSAKDFALWKSRMKYLELHRKSVRASEILSSKGSSMAESTQRGENSEAYRAILIEYREAVEQYTLLEAYRHAAEAKIEAWRTIQASNRRGHV